MRILEESLTASLVNEGMALAAAREAFLAARSGIVNPVVQGPGTVEGSRFTLKSGSSDAGVGVKVGAYWPTADSLGLARHSTTTILLHPVTGRVDAVIEGATANGYRTAAADALAVQTFARRDSRVLTVIGAGHQARYEVQAVLALGRSGVEGAGIGDSEVDGPVIERVNVLARDAQKAADFAAGIAQDFGVEVSSAALTDTEASREAVAAADVLVTATNAKGALFDAAWVQPGTHISAMGADGSGKQELPTELYDPATYDRAEVRMFVDLVDQSRAIGEFSNAPEGASAVEGLVALGDVLAGEATGRTSAEEITVFDSSGFALQDLSMAKALLAAADAQG
ncbi:ornithine cyclodeaminase family protein [Brevibacterium samyangense]|uniref:Ornithine cyclodeaminase family protein n=1 Tax=Brevibacterium samyangense TaxID=366888 RepID=A0ABN2TB57_9MICO